MKKLILVAALAAMTSGAQALNFNKEADATTELLDCKNPKISAPWGDGGRLYRCVEGRSKTVKLFINEGDRSNRKVKNIKLMWNDWAKDMGAGDPIHADKALAQKWVKKIANRYAPKEAREVLVTFFGLKSRFIVSDRYVIQYRFTPGPAINERLLIITEVK